MQGTSNVFCYTTKVWYGNYFFIKSDCFPNTLEEYFSDCFPNTLEEYFSDCFPNTLEEYFSVVYLYFSTERNTVNTCLKFCSLHKFINITHSK